MDGRHDLTLFSAMDNTGHPNSQQLRSSSYGDLCRPPGIPADPTSTLSAAYHSRYLAPLPLSTGSAFPFLGSMFPGSTFPTTSANSSFRAPSAPGISSMRQFWPPTPPPEGYGRYGMGTSLFPLFGSVSPTLDSGTYLTQGLVSRLGASAPFSHLIDGHKDPGFFSPGFRLASPLTPSSHMSPTAPFSHLIPSLDKHPTFGAMPLPTKHMDDSHDNNGESQKIHPEKYAINGRSKSEKLHEKSDSRKSSPNYASKEKLEDVKPIRRVDAKLNLQSPSKISPYEIDVHCNTSIKPDILSPPLDSPKFDVSPSPKPIVRKQNYSPLQLTSPPISTSCTTYKGKVESQCSTCCPNAKGVGIATKLRGNSKKVSATFHPPPRVSESNFVNQIESKSINSVNDQTAVSSLVATHVTTNDTCGNTKVVDTTQGSQNQSKYPSSRSHEAENTANAHVFQENATNNYKIESNSSRTNFCISASKHVTAAVIPTAPKQMMQRDFNTHSSPSSNALEMKQQTFKNSGIQSQNEPLKSQNIKPEVPDSVTCNASTENTFPSQATNEFCKQTYTKNSSSCKVKDMIKVTESPKPDLKSPQKQDEPETDKTPSKDVAVPVNATIVPSTQSTSMSNDVDNNDSSGSSIQIGQAASQPSIIDVNHSSGCKPQNSNSWTKVAVTPYNWQTNMGNGDDHQAINLTVSKISTDVSSTSQDTSSPREEATVGINTVSSSETVKITLENVSVTNTGVIGVCHPNSSKVSVASSPTNRFSTFQSVSQPDVSTEVLVSSKSALLQVPRHNATPPGTIKGSMVNTSFQSRTLMKLERLNTTKRGKVGDVEKVLPTSRGNLAALAPKLTKKVGFLKDGKTSHTLSTSSSVSSTSIVFPASAVNSCIPVGIAIAQQRQDTSTATAVGKTQTAAQSTVSEIVATTTHSNQIATEIPSQEMLRDQKPQEIISTTTCSSDPSNFLVTPGSTILSRQWESEAVTRATLPSPWVTHAPIVAPAVWIGNGAYTATTAPPTAAAVTPAVNPVDTSPISLPPGGYQLARDSITGHLFLIPSTNIVDRTPIWSSYNASTGSTLPIQHLVSQQHTQFEQVLPQGTEADPVHDCVSLSVQQTHATETSKELSVTNSCCLPPAVDNSLQSSLNYKPLEQHGKIEIKRESATNPVPPVPLASGQTFTFTTFPTNCDPSGFSYVLQSSTVMHLAHTTSSIQTESGKRSQGTSPLHCASPSPPPSLSSVHITEEPIEEESDNDVDEVACSETTHVKLSQQAQSVTTAIQVDMDAQTTSEDDDESDARGDLPAKSIEMSDSANQTENVKCDSENESMDIVANNITNNGETTNTKANSDSNGLCTKEEINSTSLEIITSEMELAPSLPVESQPVMDFIDHHGLNLLVDSIEEFASREKEVGQRQPGPSTNNDDKQPNIKFEDSSSLPSMNNPLSLTQSYGTLDTTCTDGLGLLCALAEQRFLEESLNNDNNKEEVEKDTLETANYANDNENIDFEADCSNNSSLKFNDSFDMSLHPSNLRSCELEMRKQLADLQRKYKEKELELARLKINVSDTEGESKQIQSKKNVSKRKNKAFVMSKLKSKNIMPSMEETSLSESSLSKPTPLLKKSILQKKRIKKLGRPLKKLNLYLKRRSKDHPSSKESEDEFVLNPDKVPEDTDVNIYQKSSKFIASKKRVQSNGRVNISRSRQKLKSSLQIQAAKSVKKRNTKLLKAASQLKSSKQHKSNDSNNATSENSKTPFFDEQAWCIRRSERIFLNEARSPIVTTMVNNNSCNVTNKKVAISNGVISTKLDQLPKDKKEKNNKPHHKTSEASKSINSGLKEKDASNKKIKHTADGTFSKKHQSSLSSSGSDSYDSESCEESSSQSDNVPLSLLLEQSSASKTSTCNEKLKTELVDSDNSDSSSALSEDIPLSVLLGQNSIKVETRSCILTAAELQDKTRVLILDEGLFYAGHINAIQAPDIYGITLDGERAHRPHIFSREEILHAAVLEIKPTEKSELPEGSRVCAYWSQQYRCLYPGRVAKSSSPLSDPSLLFVEFDDGDSGRIPIDDIRMLPPDSPIVSIEPNPLLILGKRKARCDKENRGDSKIPSSSVPQKGTSKIEIKCSPKIKKRRLESSDEKEGPENNFSKKECHSVLKSEINAENTNKNIEKIKRNANEIKMIDFSEASGTDNIGHSNSAKPKKHKKHKDDHKHHHKHHHHHHRHHHHKKHKSQKQAESSEDTVISMKSIVQNSYVDSSVPSLSPAYAECHTLCTEKTSELTMKIKTSPPHVAQDCEFAKKIKIEGASSSNEKMEVKRKKSKSKKSFEDRKPAKRKDRMPSVEKSKIAAFLPVRQLWRWSGKSYRRPGSKGKAKKEFYRAIQRGKELLRVGDCAVFLSTGRPHLPYIGRIETMWESWGGKMDVKVKWFYHPEETKSSKKLTQLKPGALFQSPHFDENDVQTISHKCEVLSWEQYQKKKEQTADGSSSYSSLFDNNDIYYLAGTYDPITGSLIMEPDIPKIPALVSPEN